MRSISNWQASERLVFAAVSEEVPHKEPREKQAERSKRPGGIEMKQPGGEDGESCGGQKKTRDAERGGEKQLSSRSKVVKASGKEQKLSGKRS